MSIPRLYLVVADDVDGNNRDRFVTANDPLQAIKLMREAIVEEEEEDHLDGQIRVFEVPDEAPTPRVHDWIGNVAEIEA